MDWMALEDATARRHRHVRCWNATALVAAPRLPHAKLKFDKHQRHLSPLDSQVLSPADDVRHADTDRSWVLVVPGVFLTV